jgi:hypothetical protein
MVVRRHLPDPATQRAAPRLMHLTAHLLPRGIQARVIDNDPLTIRSG